MNDELKSQIKRMEKSVDAAKRALATKAANRGQKPYYRNGKLVRGHGEQDGEGKPTRLKHPWFRAIDSETKKRLNQIKRGPSADSAAWAHGVLQRGEITRQEERRLASLSD